MAESEGEKEGQRTGASRESTVICPLHRSSHSRLCTWREGWE